MNDTLLSSKIDGEFVDLKGERYYVIRNYDQMAPFFISLVSNSDHWMFISSTGGLTAGRVQPENALFPYVPVDKVHESYPHTGSKTIVRVSKEQGGVTWEPFNPEHAGRFSLTRNLYKNDLGNKLTFEEINHDLQLAFRYSWASSESHGFVRESDLINLSDTECDVEFLDGIQNLLPAGTPRAAQTNSSVLLDAYKWNELEKSTGLALYTLYSQLSDQAEPSESLHATTVFSLGLEQPEILLTADQVARFQAGEPVRTELHQRALRGAYFVSSKISLSAGQQQSWKLVAELEQSQMDVAELSQSLHQPAAVEAQIQASIEQGSDELARLMAAADGFQVTGEETTSTHHYANVLFNVLRGGIFDNQYRVERDDILKTIAQFNRPLFERHEGFLKSLPDEVDYSNLLEQVREQKDPQLERLCFEYLPITFGRRHGDPSRPWNHFAIKLTDDEGKRLLSYQGNWRDIFQNWEALALSYPEFTENMVAKFVNATTIDGYNPYRITKEGIDWEVIEPSDPWSNIGYWGDHQIIYLQKLLEWSRAFHPERLGDLLQQPLFCYANVPYSIKPFNELLADPKDTVIYDDDRATQIEQKVAEIGADGKLVLDQDGEVYQVCLTEKLLVPLLSKLSNLVLDGGIWLNTQRPEWNDANNALVGQGLSMVTLYYMRRYVLFMQDLLADQQASFEISDEVAQWLQATADILASVEGELKGKQVSAELRSQVLRQLGVAAEQYRDQVYGHGFSKKQAVSGQQIQNLLGSSIIAIDHCIATNLREDGLYHAYNLLAQQGGDVSVEYLYMMLEGQVAVLSSGAIAPRKAIDIVETLFESPMFRPDQNTFILYPDRELPSFMERNRVPTEKAESIDLLMKMQAADDNRIIQRDCNGVYRFNPDFRNNKDVNRQLDELVADYGDAIAEARPAILGLYEGVFDHQSFTGRSGTMFGFEGLGSIYWHMVSKLLLAVQENFFLAESQKAEPWVRQRLAELYYKVREGIGFNKTPEEYGAFPCDPYSHTPKHVGAQQPGMTGQVKEEVLTRWGELGLMIEQGQLRLHPSLLREQEFIEQPAQMRYLDVAGEWQELDIPEKGLGFTFAQVPFIYQLNDEMPAGMTLYLNNGEVESSQELLLSRPDSESLFRRSGQLLYIEVNLHRDQLLGD